MKPNTSKPKAAPFHVGTRLRYTGKRESSQGPHGGEMRRVIYPGIEVTISRCDYGHQGTGRIIEHDEETGEPIYDETKDYMSIYRVGDIPPGCRETTYGRCIRREDAHEWEIIKQEVEV